MNAMLLSAAVFNWTVALLFIFLPSLVLGILGINVPDNPVWLHFFSVLVAGFGVGYYLAARSLNENRGIVLCGAIAKSALCVAGIIEVALGNIPWTILLPLAIDLTYAILFFQVLRKNG